MGAGALVFIGFMGAGKSTAASTAAQRLGGEAIDTDALLEAELRTEIGAYFDRHGETAFREHEERVALETLARAGERDAVALGGGALSSARVRAALASHVTVFVEVAAEVAWQRVSLTGADRPLARDREAFIALHGARQEVYERAAKAFLMQGANLIWALEHLLALRDGRWAASARLVLAASASGSYPVWFGSGLLAGGLRHAEPDRERFLVSDETVGRLYGDRISPVAAKLLITPGEQHKTLAQAEAVWRWLVAAGATRASTVVALGGGVVGDLAGVCAATYQRGIPVWQVPTTLVAQVDSALGGKTGVDLPEAKNYVGAYHQPALVLVDPAVLETLPPVEVAAGFAEVLKTALIAGGELWSHVRHDRPLDELVLLRCIRTKLGVVAADERDSGVRQVLNLGHTVGHAIEAATGYARYRHGEAVGLGLLAALRLSGADALRSEVLSLLGAHQLPTVLEGVETDIVVAATRHDKKRTADRVPFVLLADPGHPEPGREVTDDDLRAAVAELGA